MLAIGVLGQHRRLWSFFFGFLVLYSLIAFYLPNICYRDPSSVFWRPEQSRALSYSVFRQTQAHKLADQAEKYELTKWNATTPPQLCIGIASVSRHGFSYLRQTLGSLLEGLDERERRKIYLVVFLAHADQSKHEDSRAAWLRNMADSLPSYPDERGLLALVQRLEQSNDYPAHARKQKIDYSVLLAECAKVNPLYTMTLEDDVIALDGWFHRTLSALQTAAKKTRKMGRDNFLYLRIFRDGRLLGWNNEEWPQYAGVSTLLIVGELVIILALRWRSLVVRMSTTILSIFLICGICTPLIIGLVFAGGRSCMLPKRPGVNLMQNYGCCGQGLVFPQQRVVKDLLPLFRNTTDSKAAVDTFLENFADKNNELRWAVTPVLIQHIGSMSSHKPGQQVESHLTRNMPFDFYFELNNPEKLAREHKAWIANSRLLRETST